MESAETYEQQGRKDLAEEERYQADIIKAYLPQQLDEAAIKAKVESIIKELGATSMKDMGKVMGVATKELAGKADNSVISKFVKDALG
jgi:uncharacterized protein YqeY